MLKGEFFIFESLMYQQKVILRETHILTSLKCTLDKKQHTFLTYIYLILCHYLIFKN